MEDFHRAADCHQHSLLMAQRVGDRIAAMNALSGLGLACHQLGQLTQAIAYQQQSLEIATELGDRFAEGTALGDLAVAYQALGQPEVATHYAQRHLVIAQEIGDRAGVMRAAAILNNSGLSDG